MRGRSIKSQPDVTIIRRRSENAYPSKVRTFVTNALHTRAVFAGERPPAGKREPRWRIYSWHLTVREWGFHYKKINDSTTSQFTVGPPYDISYETSKFSFCPRPKTTPLRHIVKFFHEQKERHTEKVGPAYLNSARQSCRPPRKPPRENLTLVADRVSVVAVVYVKVQGDKNSRSIGKTSPAITFLRSNV